MITANTPYIQNLHILIKAENLWWNRLTSTIDVYNKAISDTLSLIKQNDNDNLYKEIEKLEKKFPINSRSITTPWLIEKSLIFAKSTLITLQVLYIQQIYWNELFLNFFKFCLAENQQKIPFEYKKFYNDDPILSSFQKLVWPTEFESNTSRDALEWEEDTMKDTITINLELIPNQSKPIPTKKNDKKKFSIYLKKN